jgi:hypothetical protein
METCYCGARQAGQCNCTRETPVVLAHTPVEPLRADHDEFPLKGWDVIFTARLSRQAFGSYLDALSQDRRSA